MSKELNKKEADKIKEDDQLQNEKLEESKDQEKLENEQEELPIPSPNELKELRIQASKSEEYYERLLRQVAETDNLRKEMRSNGAKFKVTKNRLTKIALEDTPYASIADLFSGPTAIAYSDDPVAPAKVSVEFEKKFENF